MMKKIYLMAFACLTALMSNPLLCSKQPSQTKLTGLPKWTHEHTKFLHKADSLLQQIKKTSPFSYSPNVDNQHKIKDQLNSLKKLAKSDLYQQQDFLCAIHYGSTLHDDFSNLKTPKEMSSKNIKKWIKIVKLIDPYKDIK